MKVYLPLHDSLIITSFIYFYKNYFAQWAGVVEYTNWFSVEGWDLSNKCPGYDN